MEEMKSRFVIAIFAALCAIPAWCQQAQIKGKVIGVDGKPMAGVTIEMVSTDTGRKYTMKTDAKGEYMNIGVISGTYDVTASKDGKTLGAPAKAFPVTTEVDVNVLDFDFAKLAASALAKESEADKAKREAILKENEKIRNLNGMLTAAKTASDAGNYDEAVRIMTQATQADATKDLIWARLGDADLKAAQAAAKKDDKATATTDYQQAAAAFKKAIELQAPDAKSSDRAAYHNNLGKAYSETGQTQDAIKEYQAAAQADPTNAALYYFNLGATLTNTGHPDEANDAFDKCIAAKPDYAEAYYQKAVNLLGKAKVDEKTGAVVAPPEVTANLNKYLELAPNGPHAAEAKSDLELLGQKIQTSFGKTKKK
jgi:tetratricopeptide (TPR) repeat protein